MKPLCTLVVAILVIAANAHPENIKDVKELPQSKEPIVEAEESEPQKRQERCTACSNSVSLKSQNDVLAAIKALPNAEVHTQESFEECSSDKGCAGIQLKDGKLVQKFGNLEAFKAAALANTGNEFQFQAAGSNSVFEGGVPNGGPFWWMNQDSPFKNAAAGNGGGHLEKFSKFQSSSFSTSSNGGAGGAGGAGGVDIAANPFLNGDFSKLASGFTSSGGNFAAGQGFESASSTTGQGAGFGAAFGAGQGAGFASGQGAGFNAGQAGFGSGSQTAQGSFGSNSQSNFAGSQNGFAAQGAQGLGGQAGLAGQGGLAGAQGGLGGGQGNFNSFSSSSSKFASTGFGGQPGAPFPSSGANVNLIQNSQKSDFEYDQSQQTQQTIDEAFQNTGNVQAHENSGGDLQQTCAGQGYICVHKAQCNNGVVNTNGGALLQANTQRQYCNTRTEVCCRLETTSLAGAGSLQGSLGVGSATFQGSSTQGSGLFSQSGSNQNSFGASGTSGFGAGQASQTNTGFGAGQTSQTNTGFSSVNRGVSGTAGFGSNTNQFSGAGTSQFGQSSFSNTNKFGGSAVGQGIGSTLSPPARFGGNFNNEVFKSTSQSNFVETDSFSSGSETAGVFRPGAVGTGLKPGIPYLPPLDTATSNTNLVSTAFATSPRPFTTPRPVTTFRPVTTVRPTYIPPVSSTAAPGYLPPVEPLDGSESRPHYVDGGLILDETIPAPSSPVGPINNDVPAGCAAALKCTPIEFCTAEGVISNTSVVLSRDQEAYRVPLTDCKDLETGRIGKCCRDPFYTDPWPVNQLGKWVPDVFGGNDGKYTPDSRGSPNILRPVVTARPPVAPVTGGVLLNNFRTTQRPLLPQGPNQVTPGYPGTSVVPGSFVKTQTSRNQFEQSSRGQFEQGGRGVVANKGQGQFGQGQFGQGSSQTTTNFGRGQIGIAGVGQTGTSGQGAYGQAGRGQLEVVGQGVQANQGSGFRVSQNTGINRQGQSINGGQGFNVVGQAGQTVSQERGSAVNTQFGSGVRQEQGTAVVQGQGFGVQRGQGFAVSQGAGVAQGQAGVAQGQAGVGVLGGQGFRQGQGIGVTQGQGQIVSQGQGQYSTQGQGSIYSQGQGQGVRVGEGFAVNQGAGSLVSRGQGVATTQGGGAFGVSGSGFGVRQGSGFGISQGQGFGVGFDQRQTLLEGQGQALIQGQGEQVSQETVRRVFLSRYGGAGQCGILNPQKPYGNRKDLELDFAEIPWQAMVLLQTNRSLLCGGVITRPDVVVTSASCVEGLQAKNVLIKGGEWKLGIDEEPLPFQIVQVKNILRHPFYKSGSLKYDAAILVLTENLRLAKNIWPICLPSTSETLDAYYNGAGECIVTGWGKSVLQAHLLGSVIHGLNVSLINPGECQNKLQQDYPHLLDNYDQESCVCGQPTNPANNICKVDTGSALACTTGDGSYTLRGIYSWESGCQVGNQLAAFYKFDLEWYEWAIGLIESVRFAQYTTTQVTKNKLISQVAGSSYTSGVKGALTSGVKESTVSGIKGFGIQGQSGIKGFGLGGQSQSGEYSQFGSTKITGSGSKFSAESGENAGINFGSEITSPVSKTFSATYTEKKFFQTEPKFVTYTTKPEIVTFTTKPEYFTYTTKPKLVTYTTKPEIVTYTTKPKIVTYTTKPKIITYETSGSVTNPKYVSPSVSFTEVVGAKHAHTAACKCLENGKK